MSPPLETTPLLLEPVSASSPASPKSILRHRRNTTDLSGTLKKSRRPLFVDTPVGNTTDDDTERKKPNPDAVKRHLRRASRHLVLAVEHAGTAFASYRHKLITDFQQRRKAFADEVSLRRKEFADGIHKTCAEWEMFVQDEVEWVHAWYHEAVRVGKERLLRLEELPPGRRDNRYIHSGYRFLSSHGSCFKSVFELHNETVNIWTHLIGLILFAYIAYTTLTTHLAGATASDQAVFLLFHLAAGICLACSCVFHIMSCHAHTSTARCAASADYIGISGLIMSSVFSVVYHAFYCHDTARSIYAVWIAAVAILGVICPMMPWFNMSKYRHLRTLVYISMAGSGALPAFHATLLRGLLPTLTFLQPIFISFASYLIGVYFFLGRYPEKWYPGRFDQWGASHQWWHLCVMGGIWWHHHACLHFWEQRYVFGCAAGAVGTRASLGMLGSVDAYWTLLGMSPPVMRL